MTESSRPRLPALLSREAWARRTTAVREARSRSDRDRGGLGWRLVAPAVFLLAGALFVTSAVSSDGTDLRAGRYGDLSTVVAQMTKEVNTLQEERNALGAEVDELSSRLAENGSSQVQQDVEDLQGPAGMSAVSGPGLTIELDDASADDIAASGVKPDWLVVHQQDIQAVVNAMWAGGAEAMTVQGQRVISTTGIKCVGNTVVLQGIPYSPPYVITAVGDPAAMLAEVNESPYIDIYLDYVERYGLGWNVLPHGQVELPAYEGPLELDYARIVDESTTREGDDSI